MISRRVVSASGLDNINCRHQAALIRKDFDTVKVRASVKKISPDDIIVRRKGVLRVINKKKPKNKQRQG